jgi:hypothetical protein
VWVRAMQSEDRLLWDQLCSLSATSRDACEQHLRSQGLDDVLLDVEPLLDGKTLCFHFLGEPTEQAEAIVSELASVYEQSVSSSKFAALLEHGCGPGCGTAAKAGCGTSGGCAVCSISGGCKSKKK